VARVHGPSDPRLAEVEERFGAFARELAHHMEKEERILFPALRALEAEGRAEGFHCGSLASPLRVMRDDHAGAEEALQALRALTDGYAPPEWACGTYRSLLEGLRDLDADLAVHVRKEEDLLFPRALALEARGSG
jgi:regulator of cell morphogenesis and NO signaling